MSKNMCLEAVSTDVQFGQTGTAANARLRGTTVGMEVRLPDNSGLGNIQVLSPLLDTDAVPKSYVDAFLQGVNWKAPVTACTPIALPANTMTGINTMTADADGALPTIDGVTVTVGQSVLILAEGGGTSVKNGIYDLLDTGDGSSPWIFERRADAQAGTSAAANAMFCEEGTIAADTAFVQTEDSPVLYNDDATTFLQFSTVVAGVTTITTAAGVTGITVLDSGGPNATVRGVKGETGVLTAALSGTDIDISVDTGGIDTIKIADGAVETLKIADDNVTPAKFAPLAAVSYIQGTILFTDENSTVNIGATSGNTIVASSSIRVITPFTNPIGVTL